MALEYCNMGNNLAYRNLEKKAVQYRVWKSTSQSDENSKEQYNAAKVIADENANKAAIWD